MCYITPEHAERFTSLKMNPITSPKTSTVAKISLYWKSGGSNLSTVLSLEVSD
jgi:hypothetical protein